MRIRYTQNENTWTSTKPVEGYSVSIDTKSLTFTINNSTGELAFSGQGRNLTEVKKNIRLAFTTLGVTLTSETRKRTKLVDVFDLDTHATLAAKVE